MAAKRDHTRMTRAKGEAVETLRRSRTIQPLSRSALHLQAVDRMRRMIVEGTLEPGERLSEANLCATLGVSRTPLREALKLLAAEGLIELRPNRSATVAPIRPADVDELFEAVSGIERIAAELAAQRLTASEIKRLQRLQVRMERYHEAGELMAYFRANQQIHIAIVAGAKNEVLTSMHGWLMARVTRARYFALHTPKRWGESVAEHRAVLAALERRDAETAGRLLGHHVCRTGEVVNDALRVRASDAA